MFIRDMVFGIRKLVFTSILSVIVLFPAGYCNNPQELVGQWINEDDGYTIELFKYGTGIINGKNVLWKVEKERFVISSPGIKYVSDNNLSDYERVFVGVENKRFAIPYLDIGYVFDYKLSDYELAFIGDNGANITFVRKEKFEEFMKDLQAITEIIKEAAQILRSIANYEAAYFAENDVYITCVLSAASNKSESSSKAERDVYENRTVKSSNGGWDKLGFGVNPFLRYFTFEVKTNSNGKGFIAIAALTQNLGNAKAGDYLSIDHLNNRIASSTELQTFIPNWR
ncbi:MAG: hypothetical protein FWF51_09245 [Chitinivibrionia bacterium]|nr:hypothetical protein [Chitinivibrionia bacterium]